MHYPRIHAWSGSVNWCVAEDYRKRRSAPPCVTGCVYTWKDFTLFLVGICLSMTVARIADVLVTQLADRIELEKYDLFTVYVL